MEDLKEIFSELKIEGLDLSALDTLEGPPSKHEEWLRKRLGRFTSSSVHRLLAYQDKFELPTGAITYATECALEVLCEYEYEEKYYGKEMERGHEKEEDACLRFMEETGLNVTKYGIDQEFFTKGSNYGGTPDGVIEENEIIVSGIETKCPNSKTHLFYMENIKSPIDLKNHCANYYWQCYMNMYVTGAKSWYFISFDDRFKKHQNQIHYIKINCDPSELDFLVRRLSQATVYKNKLIKKYE